MKSDRKRLKAEKADLVNQMQQLYATLESREEQLRDFIRNYEQHRKVWQPCSAYTQGMRKCTHKHIHTKCLLFCSCGFSLLCQVFHVPLCGWEYLMNVCTVLVLIYSGFQRDDQIVTLSAHMTMKYFAYMLYFAYWRLVCLCQCEAVYITTTITCFSCLSLYFI